MDNNPNTWRRTGAVSLVCVGALLAACSYEELTVAETDIVLTIEDNGRDYSKLKTFALPTQIADLCDALGSLPGRPGIGAGGGGGAGGAADDDGRHNEDRPDIDPDTCISVDHRNDQVVLDELAEQMVSLGYRQITDPTAETPDVVLLAGWVAQNNYYMGTSSWCDPYYYYNGCWGATYNYIYNLPTGTLLVDMADVANSADGALDTAWTFIARGYYGTSSELTPSERLVRAIDKGFSQSPYLNEGGEK